MKLEQDKATDPNDPTELTFCIPSTRSDDFGISFCIMFLNKTKKAMKSINLDSVIPSGGSGPASIQGQQIRNIGSITISNMVYEYYVGKVSAETGRTYLTVRTTFTSSKLKDGEMSMKAYEGFTFDGFSSRDYTTANVTTRFTYPHQQEFDKHKFQDVMVGDVLLTGVEQDDGTIVPDNTLKVTMDNLPSEFNIISSYLPLLRLLQNQKLNTDVSIIIAKGTVTSNNALIKSSNVQSYGISKSSNNTQFTVTFKNDLGHGTYSYDFVISSEHTGGFYVYLYGDCGENGYEATTLYRFWASNVNNNGKEFSRTAQAYTRGGYFHRGSGKNVQFKGSFHYTGNKIINKGKPYSLNVDAADNKGKSYEFFVQDLQGKTAAGVSQTFFGSSLTFVIKPDSGTLDLKSDSYFSISKNIALLF